MSPIKNRIERSVIWESLSNGLTLGKLIFVSKPHEVLPKAVCKRCFAWPQSAAWVMRVTWLQ